MKTPGCFSKTMALGALVAFATSAWPGPAAADHGRHGRKHREHQRVERVVYVPACAPVVYAPAYCPPPPPPVYWDPTCGRGFSNFEIYVEHVRQHARVSFAWSLGGENWRARVVACDPPRVRRVHRHHDDRRDRWDDD